MASDDQYSDLHTKLDISISDIADMIADEGGEYGAYPDDTNNATVTGLRDKDSLVQQYFMPGTLMTKDLLFQVTEAILDESHRTMGNGSVNNITQNFISRMDRHGTVLIPLNSLNYGYTFITRPRLNLTGANLHQHPILTTLYNADPRSVPFAIRALLDSRLSRGDPLYLGPNVGSSASTVTQEVSEFSTNAVKSPLFDVRNPFFVPLCNGLKGINGFPDLNLETETTAADFHSGDFTFAKGSDMNNKTQELSLEFKDAQGSIILSCIYYWCLYIALQAKGVVLAYPDDIYEQRLNYTVSIYRFITDQTRQNVLWWSKATGCFPKSVPIGALFNVQQGEINISSAGNFSIPFTANDVKVNDPGIIADFNRLMNRYAGAEFGTVGDTWKEVNYTNAADNFNALPSIATTNNGIKIKWLTNDSYQDEEDADTRMENIDTDIDQIRQERDKAMAFYVGEDETGA